MITVKETFRIEERLSADIQCIASEQNLSKNQVVETALKFYRDYYYMQNKACLLNEQMLQVFQASMKVLENNINQRSNQLISELAIQSAITNMIISKSLDVSQKDVHTFRLKALDLLKERQRIFRMDEMNE